MVIDSSQSLCSITCFINRREYNTTQTYNCRKNSKRVLLRYSFRIILINFLSNHSNIPALNQPSIQTAHETYNPMRPAKEMSSPTFKENSTSVTKSGYLFKKGSQRVMASWVRVYTTVDGETLTFVGRGSGKVCCQERNNNVTSGL